MSDGRPRGWSRRARGTAPDGRRPARTHQRQRHFVQVRAPRHRVVWPNRIRGVDRVSGSTQTFDLVVAANRLPVDQGRSRTTARSSWRRSPGGLVTAMEPVMRGRDGAWVGWAGEAGRRARAVRPGRHVPARRCRSPRTRSTEYYEGFSNDTLWPLYHDVIVPATFHRDWWDAYVRVNRRFAEAVAEVRSRGRDGLGARLPAAAGAGDAARAAPGPAHRLLPPHPVPAGRAVRPAAVARAAGRGAARRRPRRLPARRRRRTTSCAPAGGCSA